NTTNGIEGNGGGEKEKEEVMFGKKDDDSGAHNVPNVCENVNIFYKKVDKLFDVNTKTIEDSVNGNNMVNDLKTYASAVEKNENKIDTRMKFKQTETTDGSEIVVFVGWKLTICGQFVGYKCLQMN
ncbi:hypothetical protein Tco_0037289, partial [Tanacetum coccineum]